MDTPRSSQGRAISFRNAEEFLSALDAETTGEIVEQSADVALIVEDGVIADIAISNPDLRKQGYEDTWLGKPWVSTVTPESRAKIEDLIQTPTAEAGGRGRQVNHMTGSSESLPIDYKTIHADGGRRIVALGRDLRNVASLQQKLVRAHQDLERDYSRLRESEARYRILFDAVRDPILIVNADTMIVESANPAATALFGREASSIQKKPLADLFQPGLEGRLERLSGRALASGAARSQTLSLRGGQTCRLNASSFMRVTDALLIVQVLLSEDADSLTGSDRDTVLFAAVEALPDALIVTDTQLRILAANTAFREMAQLPESGLSANASLGDFLGRSSTDLNVLISSLKTGNTVRNFATVLTDRFGIEESVEVSAVASRERGKTIFGFSIRNVERRLAYDTEIGDRLPSSADQLTNLVGRVPLKDIVREATILIERLCIEAALSLTGDNRASAAEILGLSRQGLYSKLKRFDLDDKD